MEVDLVDILEKMETACPIKCVCTISAHGVYIYFKWNYTIERVPYKYEHNISKLEYKAANIDIIERMIHEASINIKEYIKENKDV